MYLFIDNGSCYIEIAINVVGEKESGIYRRFTRKKFMFKKNVSFVNVLQKKQRSLVIDKRNEKGVIVERRERVS